jgi:anti-sigma28 factor (negative regulator of flagellin synthesis)
MRIDPKVVINQVTRDARETPATAKTGDPASTSASVVKLSAAGASASASVAPTTTSRLQTIRAMLDKGDYPVDLDLLASRIVDDELLRVGRT